MGNPFYFYFLQLSISTSQWEKLFLSTSDKLVSRSVTPAGSSSALSTESNQTIKCHQTRPLEEVMMLSTPSSLRPVLESTSQELSSSISSQPLSMRSEPEPTDNSSIQSSSSPVRRMPLTTSPEVTTPLVRRLLTFASTESESSLISALVSKDSSSSTPSVEVPDLDSDPSSSRDYPLITERSPSSDSLSTHPHRSPPPLLSHTTPSSPPTPSSSTLMSPSCSITRLSTISAEETWTLRDQPTLTSTDSSPRLSPPSLPPSDSMVPSTSMLLSSRPTSSHTQESISCFPLMLQSSPPRRLTTSSFPLLRSPTHHSSQPP